MTHLLAQIHPIWNIQNYKSISVTKIVALQNVKKNAGFTFQEYHSLNQSSVSPQKKTNQSCPDTTSENYYPRLNFALSSPESSQMTASQFYDNLGISNSVSFLLLWNSFKFIEKSVSISNSFWIQERNLYDSILRENQRIN